MKTAKEAKLATKDHCALSDSSLHSRNSHTRQGVIDRFLKQSEVQVMLGVSRSTVWRWIVENGLKVVRIGGVTRIRESDLQAFLKRHEAGGECAEVPDADNSVTQIS